VHLDCCMCVHWVGWVCDTVCFFTSFLALVCLSVVDDRKLRVQCCLCLSFCAFLFLLCWAFCDSVVCVFVRFSLSVVLCRLLV